MIQLLNVKRKFKTHIVFPNNSFTFEDNNLYILKGENGSGKTTLLYYLALIDNEFEGKYYFDDIELSSQTLKQKDEFRNENISLLLPRGNLINILNIKENRELFCKKEVKNYDFLDDEKSPYNLSGGEEMLLALSNEVSKQKKLYLLDEITSSLSNEHAIKIMDLLKELSKNSIVIIASHDERIMSYGKIIKIDTYENYEN